MNIESARGVKAELLRRFVAPLARVPAGGAELGIAARALTRLEPRPRTLAIGLARRGKDVKVAVRVQNRSLAVSETIEEIRRQARGEVDVRYVGRIVKRAPWHRERQRPLLIGASIGHFQITAGTLGCFVETRQKRPRAGILSNNHVLADENHGRRGDAIIQPGRFDGGTRVRDAVGRLGRVVKLRGKGVNRVDAARAAIDPGVEYDPHTLRGLGTLKGLGPRFLDVGTPVAKVGRTTGVTRGRVTAFELDNVIVGYDMGNLRFDDQIEIEGAGDGPFSQGGDSGSVIVNEDGEAVALLFAGGDTGGSNGMGLTYANPIHAVLDALRVDLLA
jgi:hypothetical protein